MRKKSPFTAKEVAFFKALHKEKVPFLIVGLSAAVLQGAPVVTQDVDLWFKDLSHPLFKKVLKKIGASIVPPVALNPPVLVGEGLESLDLVTTVHGLKTFDEEFRKSKKIDLGDLSLHVLSLPQVIKSKKYLKRKKDKAVLPVLEDVLKTLNSKKK